MTEKEAINVIRKEIDSFCESNEIDCFNSDCDNCKIIVAYEMAIKALEKQIPKKPYDVDTECKTFDCPAYRNYCPCRDYDYVELCKFAEKGSD